MKPTDDAVMAVRVITDRTEMLVVSDEIHARRIDCQYNGVTFAYVTDVDMLGRGALMVAKPQAALVGGCDYGSRDYSVEAAVEVDQHGLLTIKSIRRLSEAKA